MKTNWKNKLKAVIARTATTEKSEVCLKTELTKGDKTSSDVVLSPFVTIEFTDISKNQSFQSTTEGNKLFNVSLEVERKSNAPINERCWNYPCQTPLHGATVCPNCEQDQNKIPF